MVLYMDYLSQVFGVCVNDWSLAQRRNRRTWNPVGRALLKPVEEMRSAHSLAMRLVLLLSYCHGFKVLQKSLLLDTLTLLEYYNFRRLLRVVVGGVESKKVSLVG